MAPAGRRLPKKAKPAPELADDEFETLFRPKIQELTTTEVVKINASETATAAEVEAARKELAKRGLARMEADKAARKQGRAAARRKVRLPPTTSSRRSSRKAP